MNDTEQVEESLFKSAIQWAVPNIWMIFSSSESYLGFRNHGLELYQCYHNTVDATGILGNGKDLRSLNVKPQQISYHFFLGSVMPQYLVPKGWKLVLVEES